MAAINAARAAGWVWLGLDYWASTDWLAIHDGYHPLMWSGTATDLCLGHGILFEKTGAENG